MLPQFYQKVSVLNSKEHVNLSLKPIENMAFAAKANVVHLLASEFVEALGCYPVIFVGSKDKVGPAIMTGIDADKNLFVNEQSQWDGAYVPAYVRRYPFIMANNENNKATVCIDDDYEGFNQDNEGKRLFSDAGERSELLKRAIDFMERFEKSNNETRFLCQQLVSHDLLEPLKARFKSPKEGKDEVVINGIQVVSREKLAKLSGDQLKQINDNGVLELVYYHLASLKQFDTLVARYNRQS